MSFDNLLPNHLYTVLVLLLLCSDLQLLLVNLFLLGFEVLRPLPELDIQLFGLQLVLADHLQLLVS